MSDRRRMSLQSGPYSSNQWSAVAQPSMNNYAPYPASAQPPNTAYRADAQAAYAQDGYYQATPSVPSQSMYASGSASGSRAPYQQSSYSYAQQPHPQHDAPAHTPGYAQAYAHSPPSSSRPRSHSVYAPQAPPVMAPHPQYPQQVPLAQSPGQYSGEYTSAGGRPFTCDMCSLSFNRQHDLKRHRETHTGEKPYLCNGGCGKTFTRKDALKRHQLVKGCGKVDDT